MPPGPLFSDATASILICPDSLLLDVVYDIL